MVNRKSNKLWPNVKQKVLLLLAILTRTKQNPNLHNFCSIEFFPRAGYNADSDSELDDDNDNNRQPASINDGSIQKINFQSRNTASNSNRYALQFYKETEKQLRKMREESRKPIRPATDKDLEFNDRFFDGYDFPRRPGWTYAMSKEQLDRNENRYFTVRANGLFFCVSLIQNYSF